MSYTSPLRELYDTASRIAGSFTEYDDKIVTMTMSVGGLKGELCKYRS